MIESFFVIGGLWFWLLTITATIAIIFSVEKEHGVGATICFGVYLAAVHLFGDATWFQYFGSNIEVVIGLILAYLAAGAIWSLGKWFFWNREKAIVCEDNYLRVRQEWLRDKIGAGPTKPTITEKTAIPPEYKEEWTKYVESRHTRSGFKYTDEIYLDIDFEVPRAQKHKSRIIMWMGFWPASMVFTLTRDPVRKACSFIYESLSNKYQELAEKAWQSAIKTRKKDLVKPETLPEDPEEGPDDKPDLSAQDETVEEPVKQA